MNQGSAFDSRYGGAGLIAGVGLAWGLLAVSGGMDGSWLITGFLAAGLGFLLLGMVNRLIERFLPHSESSDEPHTAKPDEKDDGESPPAPRLRVLIGSCCLEALAVALFAAYYSGSLVISAAVGVIAAAVAIGVSFLLARKLALA